MLGTLSQHLQGLPSTSQVLDFLILPSKGRGRKTHPTTAWLQEASRSVMNSCKVAGEESVTNRSLNCRAPKIIAKVHATYSVPFFEEILRKSIEFTGKPWNLRSFWKDLPCIYLFNCPFGDEGCVTSFCNSQAENYSAMMGKRRLGFNMKTNPNSKFHCHKCISVKQLGSICVYKKCYIHLHIRICYICAYK